MCLVIKGFELFYELLLGMASWNLLCPVRREGQDHEVCVQEGCKICSGKQEMNFRKY